MRRLSAEEFEGHVTDAPSAERFAQTSRGDVSYGIEAPSAGRNNGTTGPRADCRWHCRGPICTGAARAANMSTARHVSPGQLWGSGDQRGRSSWRQDDWTLSCSQAVHEGKRNHQGDGDKDAATREGDETEKLGLAWNENHERSC
jgi:hypothetical protein